MKKLIILLLCLISVASLTVTVVLLLKRDGEGDPVVNPKVDIFPAISFDPNAEDIVSEASQPVLSNPEGGGAVSLTYSKEIAAKMGNGIADIFFQNPSKSNQNIAIQLQMTDSELFSKLGKTGRTPDERQKIEMASGYSRETARIIIAESGLLAPGHKLTKLRLRALPDETVLPAGTYNAVYYILAYDPRTNERAAVNMQIPVSLQIEG